MTDPRDVRSGHLDAATIAALVDRTLDPAARAAAEAHLAACADCREVWMETSDIASETEVGGWAATPGATPSSAPASAPRVRSRRWIYSGAGLAIAAALALVVFSPRLFDRSDRPELRELVEAVGTNRATEARLTGGFQWGPVPSVTRGGTDAIAPQVITSALGVVNASTMRRRPETIRAAGIAALILGDVETAIARLEEATRMNTREAGAWSDFSAAWLEAWRRFGRAEALTAALDAADRALTLQPSLPEALFNRGLVFTYRADEPAARACWEAYLAVDPASPWAAEAKDRLSALGKR